jgi:hypothetical protein
LSCGREKVCQAKGRGPEEDWAGRRQNENAGPKRDREGEQGEMSENTAREQRERESAREGERERERDIQPARQASPPLLHM